MTLKECMNLKEIFPTTIFSVKLMHDCNYHKTLNYFSRRNHLDPVDMVSEARLRGVATGLWVGVRSGLALLSRMES